MASRDHSSSWCAGLSLSRPLLLQSTGSRRTGSVIVAHGPSCSAACGILPDQGSNLCPLHQQADSQPLRHQGSPSVSFLHQILREDPICFWCDLRSSKKKCSFDYLLLTPEALPLRLRNSIWENGHMQTPHWKPSL